MWLINFVGGTSNIPSKSHVFKAGNMNLVQPSCSVAMQNHANGVIISNDQNQATQSMGFIPQKIDHSFLGMPTSDTSSVNNYSHLLRMSIDCHDLMTKAAATKAEKPTYSSSTL